jgi:hypothetical protein
LRWRVAKTANDIAPAVKYPKDLYLVGNAPVEDHIWFHWHTASTGSNFVAAATGFRPLGKPIARLSDLEKNAIGCSRAVGSHVFKDLFKIRDRLSREDVLGQLAAFFECRVLL